MEKRQLRWISGLLSVLLVFLLALPSFAAQETDEALTAAAQTQEEPPTESEAEPTTEPSTEPATEPAHKHTFGAWTLTRRATNKKNGQLRRTCSVCGEAQTKAIPRIAGAKLNRTEKTYSGKPLTTGVTVTDQAGKKLREGRDYKLQFRNNKNVGVAEVVITGIGNYKCRVTRSFRILPRSTKFTKALASVTKVILRWKPVETQADGYQIQYGPDATFKTGAKTLTVKGASTAYQVLSGLRRNAVCAVRIRTLRTVNGRTFASGWSPAKTLTTMTAGAHTIDGQLPKSARVKSAYFDDAVFVGDSISEGLKFYEAANDKLGKAQFLTAVSLSATNALWNVSDRSKHPRLNGQKMKLEQSVPLTGAKKVYIMLGMNDITSVGVDRSAANFETLCGKILAAAPNAQLYVQSVTPRANVQAADIGVLNNASITRYNQKLAALCLKHGWYFVNVAEDLFDSSGYLKTAYCSDPNGMGMHFTFSGCAAWVDYLYTHTA